MAINFFILDIILVALASFIIGSIPFGFVIAKLKGVDIRQHGSGNIGATNVRRTLGNKAGAITLALDAVKGALSVIIASKALPYGDFAAIGGLFAVYGHCYSPFLKFKGGKGVATACGVFLFQSPIAFCFGLIVFLIVLKIKKYVSLASIAATITVCAHEVIYLGIENKYSIVTLMIGSLIILRHLENIKRLKEGTESKIK